MAGIGRGEDALGRSPAPEGSPEDPFRRRARVSLGRHRRERSYSLALRPQRGSPATPTDSASLQDAAGTHRLVYPLGTGRHRRRTATADPGPQCFSRNSLSSSEAGTGQIRETRKDPGFSSSRPYVRRSTFLGKRVRRRQGRLPEIGRRSGHAAVDEITRSGAESAGRGPHPKSTHSTLGASTPTVGARQNRRRASRLLDHAGIAPLTRRCIAQLATPAFDGRDATFDGGSVDHLSWQRAQCPDRAGVPSGEQLERVNNDLVVYDAN